MKLVEISWNVGVGILMILENLDFLIFAGIRVKFVEIWNWLELV